MPSPPGSLRRRCVFLVLSVAVASCAAAEPSRPPDDDPDPGIDAAPTGGRSGGRGGGQPMGGTAGGAGGAAGGSPGGSGGGGATGSPADAGDRGGAVPDGGSGADTRPVDPTDGPPPVAGELDHLTRPIPVLVVKPNGVVIPNGTKVDVPFEFYETPAGTTLAEIQAGTATLSGTVGIEIRGNSSANWYDQKPYGLEFRDGMNARSVSLAGLPPESDFVLHSCFSDKSCMRNALTYLLARELGAATNRWGPRTRYVEVYRDADYRGLYLLVEKIKRDRYRMAIPEPAINAAAGDLTGAYVVSLEGDRRKAAGQTFVDPLNPDRFWQYRVPAWRTATAEQKGYISAAMGRMMRALDANPTWAEAKKHFDAPPSIDTLLLQELTNNVDGLAYSFHVHKQRDADGGKYTIGPFWDVDIGYGNVNYGRRYCTERSLLGEALGARRPFIGVFKDVAFRNDLKCRYLELRKKGQPLDVARIEANLDAFAKHIAAAKMRDVARWKNIGVWKWPNNFVGKTWEDEVKYLKYWIRRRLAWMDTTMPGTCAGAPAPEPVAQTMPPDPVPDAQLNRTFTCCNSATVYIPIDRPVPSQPTFTCP